MNGQSYLAYVAVALALTTLGACASSTPSSMSVGDGEPLAALAPEANVSLLSSTPDPLVAIETEPAKQLAQVEISGEVTRLPFSSRFGRFTGLWIVDDTRVYVLNSTVLPSTPIEVGDVVQVTGRSFGSLVIASEVSTGIQLTTTVPKQAAFGLQISVQIPFPQLTTPVITLDGEIIPPDLDPIPFPANFVQLPIEVFSGFTSYSPDPNSTIVEVEFDQLVIPNVPPDTCVVVHEPGLDPLIPANQIAISQGCL
ncbi:MAG: hypothetical protein HC921_19360 [Synechococcaceae cyanobacterium SM2_3_1]|nr:hypothetical protein [Synechococcaceae cyanobacterium SM2_3_1]